MEPFVKLTGVVAPLDRTNIDTDAIIPKQFLKRIEKTGFGQFLFFAMYFSLFSLIVLARARTYFYCTLCWKFLSLSYLYITMTICILNSGNCCQRF